MLMPVPSTLIHPEIKLLNPAIRAIAFMQGFQPSTHCAQLTRHIRKLISAPCGVRVLG